MMPHDVARSLIDESGKIANPIQFLMLDGSLVVRDLYTEGVVQQSPGFATYAWCTLGKSIFDLTYPERVLQTKPRKRLVD